MQGRIFFLVFTAWIIDSFDFDGLDFAEIDRKILRSAAAELQQLRQIDDQLAPIDTASLNV